MQLEKEAEEWMKKRRGTKAPVSTYARVKYGIKKSISALLTAVVPFPRYLLLHFYMLYLIIFISLIMCVYYYSST